MPTIAGFNDQAEQGSDRVVIAGGGMAALLTAYQTLKKAQSTGKVLDIVVLADRINAPCAAGSHIVLSVDGLYEDNPQGDALKPMLREAMADLQAVAETEKLNCGLVMGYEIKGNSHEAVSNTAALMQAQGGYRAEELTINTDTQAYHLPNYQHSLQVSGIGQINTPALVNGLLDRIQQMGATVLPGVRFENSQRQPDGTYHIQTSDGVISASHPPILATGAEHQRALLDGNFNTNVIYTMGMVIGPLSEADARKICPSGPMAMCNTDLNGDVIWGGLDANNNLTIGFGDNPDPQAGAEIERRVLEVAEKFYPGIAARYPRHISYGAMLETENGMPIVGRVNDVAVIGGWGGRGLVAGVAAAKAYAEWIVDGNDARLRVFESLHESGFAQPAPATATSADLAAKIA